MFKRLGVCLEGAVWGAFVFLYVVLGGQVFKKGSKNKHIPEAKSHRFVDQLVMS